MSKDHINIADSINDGAGLISESLDDLRANFIACAGHDGGALALNVAHIESVTAFASGRAYDVADSYTAVTDTLQSIGTVWDVYERQPPPRRPTVAASEPTPQPEPEPEPLIDGRDLERAAVLAFAAARAAADQQAAAALAAWEASAPRATAERIERLFNVTVPPDAATLSNTRQGGGFVFVRLGALLFEHYTSMTRIASDITVYRLCPDCGNQHALLTFFSGSDQPDPILQLGEWAEQHPADELCPTCARRERELAVNHAGAH